MCYNNLKLIDFYVAVDFSSISFVRSVVTPFTPIMSSDDEWEEPTKQTKKSTKRKQPEGTLKGNPKKKPKTRKQTDAPDNVPGDIGK